MCSKSTRCMDRTLLIDADDTLWENNIFYLRCTSRLYDYLAPFGIAAELAQETLDRIESGTVRELGYGPEGYIEAVVRSAESLLRSVGVEPTPDHLGSARRIAEPTRRPPMVLLDGVRETLLALRPTSRLILVTKGDKRTQREKLARSGLGPLFDHKYVVPEKDADVYRGIARELGLDPRCSWMVGNSPKSDINPAVEAGLGAVYVPHDHTWTAEHAHLAQPERVTVLGSFPDLLPLFGVATPEPA
jgi:putative hydrolase of the HAD superfamily